jgi:hypothetical protein
MYWDRTNQMVTCFFEESLQYLIGRKTFEYDMSFKRVVGQVNKVLFSGWNKEAEICILQYLYFNCLLTIYQL